MKDIYSLLLFVGGGAVGVALALGWGVRALRSFRHRSRPASRGNLLRPPGYSLGQRLAVHEDQVLWPMGVLFFGCGLTVSALGLLSHVVITCLADATFRARYAEIGGSIVWEIPGAPALLARHAATLIAGLAAVIWSKHQLRDWLNERQRLRGALRGEQSVAEELQVAVRAGYHLFHNLPMEEGADIDHVLIGPAGVFAIETKTRFLPDPPGSGLSEVVFDGEALVFGDQPKDHRTPRQARAAAHWLSQRLQDADGRRLPVHPVVAIPGWTVKSGPSQEVLAINPEAFARELRDFRSVGLAPAEITRIAAEVEKLCRDATL